MVLVKLLLENERKGGFFLPYLSSEHLKFFSVSESLQLFLEISQAELREPHFAMLKAAPRTAAVCW